MQNDNTGWIKVSIKDGDFLINHNEEAGILVTSEAPEINNVFWVTADSSYARETATYEINMTTTQNVPASASNGAIFVDWPNEYVLVHSNIECRSSEYWADGLPNCYTGNGRIIINGSTEDYVGNLELYIDNMPNPLEEVTPETIIVASYDGYNSQILDRSYPNLNPTPLSFQYQGPLIGVNNGDDIVVMRGTMSAFIPITFDYPCSLNLKLISEVDVEFSIIPK